MTVQVFEGDGTAPTTPAPVAYGYLINATGYGGADNKFAVVRFTDKRIDVLNVVVELLNIGGASGSGISELVTQCDQRLARGEGFHWSDPGRKFTIVVERKTLA